MMIRGRLSSLDTLRGILVVNMVIYHIIYNLVYMYDFDMPWFVGSWGILWQRLVSCGFIILAGYCFNLSRSNFKRGLILSIVGLSITAVTYFLYKERIIIMGVISFIGLATLITVLIDKIGISPKNNRAGFWFMALCFLLIFDVTNGQIGTGSFVQFTLPSVLYQNTFSAVLGFPPAGFVSYDYFPLLPYYLLFLGGYFLGKVRNRYSSGLSIPGISFIGRHSLIIYIVHQPLALIILSLIFN